MRCIIFILIISVLGCNDNEVKLLEDYDHAYLDYSVTDVKPQVIENELKPLLSEDNIKNLEASLPELSKDHLINFWYTIYIDENGKIDAIRISIDRVGETNNLNEINPFLEKVKNDLYESIKQIEFSPAQKNNEQVKVKWKNKIPIVLSKDNKIWFESLTGFDELSPPNDFIADNYATSAEQMPSPIGGIKAIAEKVKYPIEAKENGIQGRVFLKAFIDETGDVVNVELIKGIGSGCDEAALEAVLNTKFNPGYQNGKAVKTKVTIPIMFSLK
jgi:TonB family protein